MQLPEYVAEIMAVLKSRGCDAYLVGGCVRDLLLGRKPSDYDVVTEASPEVIRSLFPRTVALGARYGTIVVITPGGVVEVSTWKSRYHSPLPGLTGIEADLFWRDFTINAMAMDENGAIFDPFGGLQDLKGRIIASPAHQAAQRFRHDPLRMVRAIRLGCTLDFTLHPRVTDAIVDEAPLLSRVAVERIRGELDHILLSERPAQGIRALATTGLLAYILPELMPLLDFDQKSPRHDRDGFEHTMAVLAACPPRLTVRLAALLHDVGKPACFTVDHDGRGHFYNHHIEGSRVASAILQRLKYDRRTAAVVTRLVYDHMSRFPHVREGSLKKLISRVGEENLDDLFDLQRADILGSAAPFDTSGLDTMQKEIGRILALRPPLHICDLAIDGNDLIALGYEPGPRIGRVLEALLDEVLEQPEMNQAGTLLEKAKAWLKTENS